MKYFRPHNWGKWQDCRYRNADWIKNWPALLDDVDYHQLTLIQRAVLHGLWLAWGRLGRPLPWDCSYIGRLLACDCNSLGKALPALEANGFIELCERTSPLFDKQSPDISPPEIETETEIEIEKKKDTSNAPRLDTPPPLKKKRRKGAREYDPDFLAWWERYPRREAKGDAFDAYWTMRDGGHSAEALQAGAVYAADKYAGTEPEFVPLPATFLRREQFLDAGSVTTGETGPPGDLTPEQKLDWWKQRFEEDARSNHQGQNQVCGGDAGPERPGGNGRAEPRNIEGLQPIKLPTFGVLHGGRGGG